MKNGFTLIEFLVTMAVFAIIVTAVLGLFSSAFQQQKISSEYSYLLGNVSYVTEYMSRALRMAKKDKTGLCITQNNNYELVGESNEHIKFLNSNNEKDECQDFYLQGGQLTVMKSGIAHPITPLNIIVERLAFALSGETQDDDVQPKVTFNLKLTYKGQDLEFQTSVSQRNLDVRY